MLRCTGLQLVETMQKLMKSGECIVVLYATPNPFLLNIICLNQVDEMSSSLTYIFTQLFHFFQMRARELVREQRKAQRTADMQANDSGEETEIDEDALREATLAEARKAQVLSLLSIFFTNH